MSEDRIEGAAKEGWGRMQDAVGGLVGDDKTQAKGKMNEAAGSVQDTFGQVKGQAQDAFKQASSKAQDALGKLETYVRDQPRAAIGIGVGIGVVLGLLLHGGRKTVYVRK